MLWAILSIAAMPAMNIKAIMTEVLQNQLLRVE
jgi:hypothetical protein